MPQPTPRTRNLVVVGALGAAAFATTVKAVAAGIARETDERAREGLARARSPLFDAVSAIVTPLTSPALLISSSLALAIGLRRSGRDVWGPIAVAPFLAMVAGACFTATLPRQCAPTTSDKDDETSFPSGHTTGAATEALTIYFVLRRRGVISSGRLAAILLLPVAGGLNRLYRDRHWTSDIVAGLSAGAALAAALTLTSEHL